MSLSARRAWIEIEDTSGSTYRILRSLSARRAWIEILYQLYDTYAKVSLSARRAWIEIQFVHQSRLHYSVALRKESVDRNSVHEVFANFEGVALRKESVDRNIILTKQLNRTSPSLSARRAWIEILNRRFRAIQHPVALRKESVDRNCFYSFGLSCVDTSLSARRAWIEISRLGAEY